MPSNEHRTGLVVSDDYKHAVRRRWLRSVAVCGAGAIVVHRDEVFDPHATLACPACRDATSRSRPAQS